MIATNQQNEFQANFDFYCIRVANARAKLYLIIFFSDLQNRNFNVFDSVLKFETTMR